MSSSATTHPISTDAHVDREVHPGGMRHARISLILALLVTLALVATSQPTLAMPSEAHPSPPDQTSELQPPRPAPDVQPGWRRVHTGIFSVSLPEGWRYIHVMGEDSAVGRFAGPDFSMDWELWRAIDTGRRPEPAWGPGHEVTEETIADRPATVVVARSQPATLTGVRIPVFGSWAWCLEWEDQPDVRTADTLSLFHRGQPLTDSQVETVLTIARSVTPPDPGRWERVDAPTDARIEALSLHGIPGTRDITGWAVGEAGTMLELVDGAWHVRPSPTSQTLHAVHVQADYGWAVGDGGTILEFGDGIWRAVDSPTAATLRGGSEGWAPTWLVGDGVLLRHTGPRHGGTWTLADGSRGGIDVADVYLGADREAARVVGEQTAAIWDGQAWTDLGWPSDAVGLEAHAATSLGDVAGRTEAGGAVTRVCDGWDDAVPFPGPVNALESGTAVGEANDRVMVATRFDMLDGWRLWDLDFGGSLQAVSGASHVSAAETWAAGHDDDPYGAGDTFFLRRVVPLTPDESWRVFIPMAKQTVR